MLRQYLPKGSDLSARPADDLRSLEDPLNNRPRKTLGWRTPAEVFAATRHHEHPQRCEDRSNPP
jgi:IS30 family transposase